MGTCGITIRGLKVHGASAQWIQELDDVPPKDPDDTELECLWHLSASEEHREDESLGRRVIDDIGNGGADRLLGV